MSAALTQVMRARLQTNALKHKPTTRAGLMITGGGYQGKTETACEIAAAFEDAWLDLHAQLAPHAIPGTRDLHAPVAYIQTPVTAKPKSTCQAILDFYGADHRKMNLPQLTRQVRASLHDHGTRPRQRPRPQCRSGRDPRSSECENPKTATEPASKHRLRRSRRTSQQTLMKRPDPILRQLPRSLDPLTDESLPGYLLRLARRLDTPPAHLIGLVGLQTNTHIGSTCDILGLSDIVAENFAWTTRLSRTEVADLLLITMADRYPPLSLTFLGKGGDLRSVVSGESWLFFGATRYCPECLRGDDSVIQQRHGGAWKRAWRLPITFCCTTHQRILEYLCPRCRTPAHSRAGFTGSHGLIVNSHVAGLHPTQCRTPLRDPARPGWKNLACGQRLDELSTRPTATDSDTYTHLQSVQQLLIHLLAANGPTVTASCGLPATITNYFTDLRIITELTSTSWPAARTLASTSTIASIIDNAIDEQHRQTRTVTTANGRPRNRRAQAHRPPLAAAGTGCLLTLATSLLGHADQHSSWN